jgi:hypothetical protein
MSPYSTMTAPKPTWLRVSNTAPHVVCAIRGSHHTTSTIAKSMPSTPWMIRLRDGRRL